jgi:hypothetical protein
MAPTLQPGEHMAKVPYPGLRGGPEEVTLNFRFQINGTSDPDAFFGSGGLVTDIVRDAAGEFTITLDKNYRFANVINCFVASEDLGVDGYYVAWTQSTGALQVSTIADAAATTEADPTDDTWVHVSVTFCRRSDLASSQSI